MKKVDTSSNVFRPLIISGDECTEVVVNNILDVYLYNLKFFYHPLFSVEHVFAEKLKNLYDEYISYKTENKLEKLRKKLVSVRSQRKDDESSGK